MSGTGGPGNMGGEVGPIINVPQGGEVLTSPAVWVNPADASTWVFIANDSGMSGLQVSYTSSYTPTLTMRWQSTNGGTSPVVAAGILFYASSGHLRALDPVTGSPGGPLWQSMQVGSLHWQSPIVAHGVVYIADQTSAVTAFSLNGVAPAQFYTYVPFVLR
jgi:putative pyrroloquinoline-quinone-binding quinoprotein